MKFGFLFGIGEITPSIFSKISKVSRAEIFLNLYNSCVENELKIPLGYAKFNVSLEQIFLKRINELCKFRHQSFKKATKFCVASNIIIAAFKNGNLSQIPILSATAAHPAARLIMLLNAQSGVCFDADIMFSQFVYDKIRRKHPDKKVYFQDGIIFAELHGKKLFGVLPSFKEISKDRFHLADFEIAKGFEALSGAEFDKMFVVFPRSERFCKHIEVKRSAYPCDLGLKLVPYTISHKIF